MDISIILQVVTVAFAVVTLIAGVIFENVLNRKTRKVNTITNERIYIFNQLRKGYCKVMAYTDPNYIADTVSEVDLKTGVYREPYIYRVRKSANDVKSVYNPFFIQEKHIEQILDKLVAVAIKYYNTLDPKLLTPLKNLRNDFFVESSLYDKANWDFIVAQADGKSYSSYSFDNMYKDVLSRVSNTEGSTSEIPNELKNPWTSCIMIFIKNLL